MKRYENILVNALINLGDVVLTTGAIALLKEAYPAARITMLVKPAVREAVENNPLIDADCSPLSGQEISPCLRITLIYAVLLHISYGVRPFFGCIRSYPDHSKETESCA